MVEHKIPADNAVGWQINKATSPLSAQITHFIGETPLAKFYFASFQQNCFKKPRIVYAVENLDELANQSMVAKGALDLYRSTVLKSNPKAAEYRKVLPISLSGYTDELTLDNQHAVMLYEIGDEIASGTVEVLESEPKYRLSIGDTVWVTERLLRIAEALHEDDLIVDLSQPRYLVNWDLRALRLLNFYQFRYALNLSYVEIRRNLRQIARVVRNFGNFEFTDPATQQLDAFLTSIEQLSEESPSADFTVAKLREEFIGIFPESIK